MALLIMAVYDTNYNGRSEYTVETLKSLSQTVNWNKHRLIIVDNGSCEKTKKLLSRFESISQTSTGNFGWKIDGMKIITNDVNLGTARAINQGLKYRQPGEYCIKIDNDVVINHTGWVDEMEAAIERDPTIGIIGLKRKDINFDANHADPNYRSTLIQLPHQPGQTWITVERGPHIMGTCTMFNWRLIDKIGGMAQAGVYGNDDSLYSLRSTLAGFWNCYLPHINIDHIDDGTNPYTQEKHRQASEKCGEYTQMHHEYVNGLRPLWEDFE